MRWIALAVIVALNVAVLTWLAMPFLVTYAEITPQDITCSICAGPEVQHALARAAAVGRGQILEKVQAAFPVFVGLGLANLAFVLVFAMLVGRHRAA